jgi:hypothetical protein
MWTVVRSTLFETAILLLILFNCALLALDNPGVGDNSALRKVRHCGFVWLGQHFIFIDFRRGLGAGGYGKG